MLNGGDGSEGGQPRARGWRSREGTAGDTSPAAGHALSIVLQGKQSSHNVTDPAEGPFLGCSPFTGACRSSNQTQVQTGAALVPCQATVIRNLITHSPSDH